MKSYSELICDDNGFEILVEYNAERADPEDYHAELGTMICTELKSVEIVIAGRGIQLLNVLHENEKEFIISKLTYEN